MTQRQSPLILSVWKGKTTQTKGQKMSNEVTRLRQTEVSKQIRKDLKAAFPGQKFSVRTERGGATRVHWTDGPTEEQVAAVTAPFNQRSFDGMTDSNVFSDAKTHPELGLVQCYGFLFLVRDYSAEFLSGVAAEYEVATGIPSGEYTIKNDHWTFHSGDWQTDQSREHWFAQRVRNTAA